MSFFLGGDEVEVVSSEGLLNESQAAPLDPVISSTQPPMAPGMVMSASIAPGELAFVEESGLVGVVNPIGTMQGGVAGGQIFVYTVKPGDTITGIATSFGITLNTLLWANDLTRGSAIKTGDSLIILPVSGVQYEVKKGDTIESIAKKYSGDTADILAYNGLAPDAPLDAGTEIIIPDGEMAAPIPPKTSAPASSATPKQYGGLPQLSGYYMRPIIGGRNARSTKANPHGIHGYNGVDLAKSCGTPVFAAANGTIIIAKTGGWNGGYGNYIVMTHPNGTQTLYAHLQKVLGKVGQTVAQGSQIALLGTSGNSTGCHVHFEVRGAQNPF